MRASWIIGPAIGAAIALSAQYVLTNTAASTYIEGIILSLKIPGWEGIAARRAVSGRLFDPYSAHFSEMQHMPRGTGSPLVCGEVNSKNRMGAYIGMQQFAYDPATDLVVFKSDTDEIPAAQRFLDVCDGKSIDLITARTDIIRGVASRPRSK